jgi:hypothetical protein
MGAMRSTFLFATPSWTEGVGRLTDFGNHLNGYNVSASEDEADARALAMDWRSVGDDLQRAMLELARSLQTAG